MKILIHMTMMKTHMKRIKNNIKRNIGGKKPWRDFGIDFLYIGGVLIILWVIDPLGAATQAKFLSESLFYRIVATLYPPDTNDPNEIDLFSDNSQIAVIIINDETLENIEINEKTREAHIKTVRRDSGPRKRKKDERHVEKDVTSELMNDILLRFIDKKEDTALNYNQYVDVNWPPALGVHASVLEKIFNSFPKAVLIDFAFFDDREPAHTAKLAQTLATYALRKQGFPQYSKLWPEADNSFADSRASGSIPIFLVGPDENVSRKISPRIKVLPELAASVTGLVSTRYIGDNPETYNLYEFYDCGGGLPSAAIAMYAFEHQETEDDQEFFDRVPCSKGESPETASVYWATWGTAEHSRGAYKCRTLRDTDLGRVAQIFEVWLFQLWKSVSEFVAGSGSSSPQSVWAEQFQPCPPHRSVSAHDFLADDSGAMSAFIVDRYVFYGGNFVMADDLIRSPAHESMPGVFLHAMVLDNLLRDKVVEAKSRLADLWGAVLTVLAIALAAFCSAAAWNSVDRLTEMTGQSSPDTRSDKSSEGQSSVKQMPNAASDPRYWFAKFAWFLMWFAVCAALIAPVLYFGFFVLKVAPINYVGIVSVIGLHGAIRSLHELVKKFL